MTAPPARCGQNTLVVELTGIGADDGDTVTLEEVEVVVMPDDTIVTVHDGYRGRGTDRRLTALRWRVPPRQEVEGYGFFTPNLAG